MRDQESIEDKEEIDRKYVKRKPINLMINYQFVFVSQLTFNFHQKSQIFFCRVIFLSKVICIKGHSSSRISFRYLSTSEALKMRRAQYGNNYIDTLKRVAHHQNKTCWWCCAFNATIGPLRKGLYGASSTIHKNSFIFLHFRRFYNE